MIRLFALTAALLLCSCADQLPTDDLPCPCAPGWTCCQNENQCVRPGDTCPCIGQDCLLPTSKDTGQLWVTPNPILFQPEAASQQGVSISNLGSEEIGVLAITLMGDPAFSFVNPGSTRLPWTLPGGATCLRGAALDGFYLEYQPSEEPTPLGYLLVETDDPAHPAFSVNIALDQTNSLDLGRGGWASNANYVLITPNPIRLDPLPPGERVEFNLSVCPKPSTEAEPDGEQEPPILLTRIAVVGRDFYLIRFYEPQGGQVALPIEGEHPLTGEHLIRLAYAPVFEQSQNGQLEIEFIDRRGISQTLSVPLVIE